MIPGFLNMRGSDLGLMFYSYLIVTMKEILLFIDARQLPDDWTDHLRRNGVRVHVKSYDCVEEVIMDLEVKQQEGKLWISPTSNYLMNSLVEEERRHQEISAICSAKMIKNNVEVAGMRACHYRDGKALCQYFAWLEGELNAGRKVTEVSGADKLTEFRSKLENNKGISFGVISAFGPNGAIIHYSPSRQGEQYEITKNNLYLCDSGGQFL